MSRLALAREKAVKTVQFKPRSSVGMVKLIQLERPYILRRKVALKVYLGTVVQGYLGGEDGLQRCPEKETVRPALQPAFCHG